MFELPSLPYDYGALEPYIDKETMMLHHDKHHAAYVKNLNEAIEKYDSLSNLTIEDLLANINSVPEEIRTIVNNNGGGHYNHSLFWNLMSPKKESPDNNLLNVLISTFGSFDTFKEKFSDLSAKHFGSGWGWLVIKEKKLDLVDTNNQDAPVSKGLVPILGLDIWEHAYYLKYQNRRLDYINAWWNVVNWTEVSKRLQEYLK